MRIITLQIRILITPFIRENIVTNLKCGDESDKEIEVSETFQMVIISFSFKDKNCFKPQLIKKFFLCRMVTFFSYNY